MVKVLVAVVLAMFVGCAGSGRRYGRGERYLEELRAWKGQDINALIALSGPPTSVFQAPNGQTMFTWTHRGPVTYGSYSYGGFTSGGARQSYCVNTFTVAQDGTITRILTEGDACSVPVAPRATRGASAGEGTSL